MMVIKVSCNVSTELVEYLKKRAGEKDVSVTEFLTKLISAGKFVEEAEERQEKIFTGRDSDHLRQVVFR